MRNKYATVHVMKRDEMFYYVRHIPYDLINIYSVKRLCFSLKTKSYATAVRFVKSVKQRLGDYCQILFLLILSLELLKGQLLIS